MSQAPDRYAVIGHPVAHSRSPQIHAEFARLTGQPVHYARIEATADGFIAAVREFLVSGGRGLNVTQPFKEQAFALCHVHTPRAQRARAVNTLYVHEDHTLAGDNTDGAGLVSDLRRNHQLTLRGSHVLILGAGGAARGILPALMDQQPAGIRLANRTAARARHLAASLEGEQRIAGGGYDELDACNGFDLVINATSASLSGELPPLPSDLLNPGAVCYDLSYADRPSLFMHWAEREGAAQVLDGWGMLVEQAAESFYVWRGVRPPTATLLALHP
ncbi:MAG TPA: shikimate dehydrogenase [Gammaproteobacteria bacterium]|nr:shikimate dehydrogenase [Gammaproteobacteria bacterium]